MFKKNIRTTEYSLVQCEERYLIQREERKGSYSEVTYRSLPPAWEQVPHYWTTPRHVRMYCMYDTLTKAQDQFNKLREELEAEAGLNRPLGDKVLLAFFTIGEAK